MKIILNPDNELVKEINQKLEENNGYCPCKLLKNENTKCMCKEFREKQDEGICHCGKFIKVKGQE